MELHHPSSNKPEPCLTYAESYIFTNPLGVIIKGKTERNDDTTNWAKYH